MSHPIPAIVESTVDLKSIERQVQKAHIALLDADKRVESDEKRCERSRETQRIARAELGRLLISAKTALGHGKWLPFLERQGIAQQSAHRWMKEAEAAETPESPKNENVGDLPQADVPTDDSNASEDDASPSKPEDEPFHILVDAKRFRVSVLKLIGKWPEKSVRHIPTLLRGLADEIEAQRCK